MNSKTASKIDKTMILMTNGSLIKVKYCRMQLEIQEVAVALRTKRLRWYGHVPCAFFWTNSISSIAIPGLKRMWETKEVLECVKVDVDVCNLEGIDPQNREAWRSEG